MVTEHVGQGPVVRSPRACGLVRRMRLAGPWLAMAAALLSAGCSDGVQFPGLEFDGIVSDPALRAAAPVAGARLAPGRTEAEDVAYIFLPPDSIPRGQLARIRNLRTGIVATAVMLEGGFDPVALPATVGDAVELEIELEDSDVPVHLTATVPAAKKPRVVRVFPPHKKRDVVLNAQPMIVFSEPIDPTTLTEETIRLWRQVGSVRLPVPGRVEFRDPDRLTAAFAPAQPLMATAAYQLVVSADVRDDDGEALTGSIAVQFMTGTSEGQIAFVFTPQDGSGNGGEIHMANADGTDRRRLTNSLSWGSWDPTWSPDGTRLAFVSLRHRALDGGGAPNIYMMNADGSGVSRLTADWLGDDRSPAWSPDGGRIAFSRSECLDFGLSRPERQCLSGPGNAGAAIYVMNADGSGAMRLAEGMDPAWSPDGSKIVFARVGDGASDIYVMNDDGSGVTKLTNGPAVRYGPTWSPEGDWVAFGSGPDGYTPQDIYVMRSDGSGLRRLTQGGGESPAWSPDGSKIVFTRFTSGGGSVLSR